MEGEKGGAAGIKELGPTQIRSPQPQLGSEGHTIPMTVTPPTNVNQSV